MSVRYPEVAAFAVPHRRQAASRPSRRIFIIGSPMPRALTRRCSSPLEEPRMRLVDAHFYRARTETRIDEIGGL